MKSAGPVGRPRQVRGLRGGAHEPPGALVAAVSGPRRRGLDLRPLSPLVVARDGDDVRVRREHRRPEGVVGRTVAPRAACRWLPRTAAVVAGADARCAQQAERVCLQAQPRELRARVVEEIVGVEAVEMARRGEADERRPREHAQRRWSAGAQGSPVGRGEVTRVVDVDIANAERRDVREVVADRRRRAVLIRLEVDRDLKLVFPRRREHQRQPLVLQGATAPPGDDDLVDARSRDLRHLPVDDSGTAARVRPVRRVEGRVDVARRLVAVLVPVLPGSVMGWRAVPGVVEDRDRSGMRDRRQAQACAREPHDQEAPQHPRILSRVSDAFQLPGFVDAHSHGFQRALRGRSDGEDFWAWRESMLDLARGQTPQRVREDYAWIYGELRDAGYTAVGEFHYLGLAEAHAAAEAASEAGVELVLLYVAYARGGLERFRQASGGEDLRRLQELRDAGI